MTRPAPILDLWAAGESQKAIARALDLPMDRVKKAVARARRRGDPRAVRRRILSGQRQALLAARHAGETYRALAVRFGVTEAAIRAQVRKALAA